MLLMVARRENWISPEEYLALERASSDIKHEYIDGHMYAMSGGTAEHGRIAYNMANLLDAHLANGPCRFFQSDVKVQLSENRYVYPDVSVSCDQRDRQRGIDVVHFPTLSVEVLSPSTEAYDRGKMFAHYQRCPSIQEYVLISAQYQLVEIYRRQEDIWTYRQFEAGQEVELASVNLKFPIAALYRGIDIPEIS